MRDPVRQILGIRFHAGNLASALERASGGGLVVVPSAPVLAGLRDDPAHREALEGSDFALTDSGFMVILWLGLRLERLPRISGWAFMRALVDRPDFREPGASFWVMPSRDDLEANVAWLRSRGIPVDRANCHVAPVYPARGRLEDPVLLAQIESQRPRYVIICLGGGVQERLGFFLKSRLPFRPTILCTGAAIAFFSGRQVAIPRWADRLFLGWLFRVSSDPARYAPRFWKALRLAPLLIRYGSRSVGGRTDPA